MKRFPRLSRLARRLALSGVLVSSTAAVHPAPVGGAGSAPGPKTTQSSSASHYARWQASMDAFAAADKAQAPAEDGVLFVGSSTIRFWTQLPQDFRDVPVLINRGFGGSTMADCQYFVKQLVLQYRPRQVFVYAGDNDLAEGRSPQQVLESFEGFVAAVRAELPDTRIAYISIKPSPLRAELMPRAREANALLAAYVRSLPNSDYIDIFTPMLDLQGAPRAELFGPDRLHMSDAGYRLWRSVIADYVGRGQATLQAGPYEAVKKATQATAAPPVAIPAIPEAAAVQVSTGR
ncbi:lysophospholipase L1-like esterase [Acidovorax sp. CF316]|uniref:SGNH/GDSL hydrolase family protein n=1 Tax=Acidovorax sp. CF316 TaxID=1144317 RepID=UPI00026BE497|nr:SGNH/GDSL hydrolase family protein [Acidovorax sp. CF316]EJE52827.1 lysophospholipase L1-like esterase [Acidovorax sp. CF316]